MPKAKQKAVMGRIRCGKYTYETNRLVSVGDVVIVEVSKEWATKLGFTRRTTVTSIDPGDYEGPCCNVLKVLGREVHDGKTRLKEWRNDAHKGQWDARVIWYHDNECHDIIRLQMEDCDRLVSVYPQSVDEADHLWFQFKSGAPEDQLNTPFVTDLLDLMRRKYPHLPE